jgi:hypothetical protein
METGPENATGATWCRARRRSLIEAGPLHRAERLRDRRLVGLVVRAGLLRDLRDPVQGLLDAARRAATHVAAGDFAWQDAPEGWQRSLRELAVTLEADWPALGLSH